MVTQRADKLSILLCTSDTNPNIETVVDLCESAIRQQADIYLYLIDEGGKNVRNPRLLTLAEKGMKLFACAYGCQKHGVPTTDLDPNVSLCGLVVLSNMMDACDRFLALT